MGGTYCCNSKTTDLDEVDVDESSCLKPESLQPATLKIKKAAQGYRARASVTHWKSALTYGMTTLNTVCSADRTAGLFRFDKSDTVKRLEKP
jgi:hypothetical protein